MTHLVPGAEAKQRPHVMLGVEGQGGCESQGKREFWGRGSRVRVCGGILGVGAAWSGWEDLRIRVVGARVSG